ncbi:MULTISPECIES: PTS sugar transporter subunit IIA [unclassified Mannheimia]|uniref:PTS sugar transporter subunit IIA n=1 Tax=unclassified Mannheimia TaxID=2645054 RepID=UPI00359CFC39
MSNQIALLLMSHGGFAGAAIASAELIVGSQENIATIGVVAVDNVSEVKRQMEDAIAGLNTEKGLIILTDIVGGTPMNLASTQLTHSNVLACSGLNLPLLLEVLMSRDGTLQEIRENLPLAYQNGFTLRTQQDLYLQEENDDLL